MNWHLRHGSKYITLWHYTWRRIHTFSFLFFCIFVNACITPHVFSCHHGTVGKVIRNSFRIVNTWWHRFKSWMTLFVYVYGWCHVFILSITAVSFAKWAMSRARNLFRQRASRSNGAHAIGPPSGMRQHTHSHTQTHIHARIHTHTHKHTCHEAAVRYATTHTHTHTYKHAHTHVRARARARTHTHTHTYAHTANTHLYRMTRVAGVHSRWTPMWRCRLYVCVCTCVCECLCRVVKWLVGVRDADIFGGNAVWDDTSVRRRRRRRRRRRTGVCVWPVLQSVAEYCSVLQRCSPPKKHWCAVCYTV